RTARARGRADGCAAVNRPTHSGTSAAACLAAADADPGGTAPLGAAPVGAAPVGAALVGAALAGAPPAGAGRVASRPSSSSAVPEGAAGISPVAATSFNQSAT